MKYGLIGSKLTHSFSKVIHEKLGNYDYELLEISEENFHSYMLKKDFNAINVTIPYKEKVIPYLDIISPQAKKIGAINTVINKDGKLYGYNTDYYGLKALLGKLEINCKRKKILILGSGGTSKTTKAVIEDMGCNCYYFVSRTKTPQTITYQEAIKNHSDCNLIINTTPRGMYPNNKDLSIDIDKFKKLEAVVDVIYNPLRTKLIVKAQNNKIVAIGGLYMLVAQAFYASCLFQNKNLSEELMDDIYHNLMRESEYILKFGEGSFRIIESQIIEEVSKRMNIIIATGGGAILNAVNIENLKENGKIIFLNRCLDKLIATGDRPLTTTREMLETRYYEREPLYKTLSDLTIDNNHSLENAVDEIIEGMKI